jgi:hypothetical protein
MHGVKRIAAEYASCGVLLLSVALSVQRKLRGCGLPPLFGEVDDPPHAATSIPTTTIRPAAIL